MAESRKRKRQRLNSSEDDQALLKNADSAASIPDKIEDIAQVEKLEHGEGIPMEGNESHRKSQTEVLEGDPNENDDSSPKTSPLPSVNPSIANVSTGLRLFEKAVECSKQLEKLQNHVERLGGKLEDGWRVVAKQRFKAGTFFFIFISPRKERFRSRVQVARHMGLFPNGAEKSYLGKTRLESTSHLALVPFDHEKMHVRKGTNKRPILNKDKNHGRAKPCFSGAGKAVHALNENGGSLQVTKATNLSPSLITERCQAVLRSIISTQSFAVLSNMVNRGLPSLSIDATLQPKVPSYSAASSLDLQLIHLRLSTGAYGKTPELFSADIQQLWRNIISAGNELVTLGHSLSELSDNLFKQQIMSLLDGISTDSVVANGTSNEQCFGDPRVLPENHVMRMPNGVQFGNLLVGSKQLTSSAQARFQKIILSKKAVLKAGHQLSRRGRRKIGQTKKPMTSNGKSDGVVSEDNRPKCGLELDINCAVCKISKARHHTHCEGNISPASVWTCPLCSAHQDMENPCRGTLSNKGVLNKKTKIELLKMTCKTGVCKACKKEDDNVLLCDACDAAYHMSCLTPPVDSVPDGFWYCPTCDEAESKRAVSHQDAAPNHNAHNCVVCDRVPQDHVLCESTPQICLKDTSPACIDEQEHSLSQGGSENCIEPSFLLENEDVCKICGVDKETGKKIIVCSGCQKCYHLSCLRPALKKLPRKTWYCPSCICRVCEIDADDDMILLCDACDEGYHTYCLDPPIHEIPEGAWFCTSCAKSSNLVLNSPSKTEVVKKKRKSNEPKRSI